MTLGGYWALSYLMVAGVFSTLLASSEDWQEAALEKTGWLYAIGRCAVLVVFGVAWPIWLLALVLEYAGVP